MPCSASTCWPTDVRRIVAVDVPAHAVDAIARRADVVADVVGPDGLADALVAPALAVVAAADGGADLARMAQRAAPGTTVLFVAAGLSEKAALDATLAVTPGIGRRTRSFAGAGPDTVDAIAEEIAWTRRRAAHRQTIASVRRTVTDLLAAPPEAASRYLGQLFDHAPIGILVAEPNGVIRAANPRSAAVIGRHPRDAAGSRFSALFSGSDAALAEDLVHDCVTSGGPAVEMLTRTGTDGTPQHLEVTVAAVDPEVPSLGVIILLHDESARIHALESAEHARHEAEAAAGRYAELSRTLQQSLLPPDLPDIAGAELAARYHAAGDGTIVGGDFYDVVCLADGRWCILLGDVSGKGVGAAALTSLARYCLRTAALTTSSVGELVGTLNTVLGDYARGERFCTLAAVLVDAEGGIEVALAGHPAPTVIRGDGSLEAIGDPAPPVGLFDRLEVTGVGTVLHDGDSIVITSDGVTEARTPAGDFVPDLLDRVLPTVAGRGAEAIADAVDAAVLAVERSRTRDDVAIVVLSRGRASG